MGMTFREIAIWAEGVNERRNEEWKENFRSLYITAKLIRADKFPKWEDLMPAPSLPRTVPKKIRDRMNRDRFKAWSDRHNARLGNRKKTKKDAKT